GGITCVWTLATGPGAVEAAGPTEAVFRAGEATGTARVTVTARHEDRGASAEADVEVVEEIATGEPRTGIPETAFVAAPRGEWRSRIARSEEHTSELQSLRHLVCRLLLE